MHDELSGAATQVDDAHGAVLCIRQIRDGSAEAQLRLLLAGDHLRHRPFEHATQVPAGDVEELLAVCRIAGGGGRPHHYVNHAVLDHAVGVDLQSLVHALQGLVGEATRGIHALTQAHDDVIPVELVNLPVRGALADQ